MTGQRPFAQEIATLQRAHNSFFPRLREHRKLDRAAANIHNADPKRALVSAATIAGAYIAGGLIPLAPYFVFSAAARALAVSVAFTLLALFVFGYVKGHFTGARPIRSALQTALVGGLAAAAAFAIARAIS